MRSLFSIDGPLYKFFGTFANLVILNLIAILCCLPLITAGASLTALHYVTFKMVRNEDDHIVRQFFKAFKDNIKQGILLWIPLLLLIIALGFDAWLLRYAPDTVPKVFQFVFFAGLFVILLVAVWVFPLLMHFAYPRTTDYIRNGFLLSLSHLPRTLLMAAITVAPLFFAYVEPFRSAIWLLAIGLSLPVWLKSWLYNSVFKKLEPEEEEESEEAAPLLQETDPEGTAPGIQETDPEEAAPGILETNSEGTAPETQE